ncbi:peptide cleavage/export ABC transporter [Pediococcus pentosaceus]|uniref:peptide cleavage/export ABC transporter n=1 Tax=Pediococcus pentosaceus TaxID=1255 RepID=UPI001C1EC5FD|nr:peptide cleavage/export ABC transporter [Pediococcus pentosaceus]MBU7002300.1 peptide cleavage/export ABC transporter [Pediococcus pentosaceus]MCG9227523.1 peptide cleavage/export ABC transporter [Pediococcus pentosaceus]MDA8037533.1 peptide cleavage/export ABC transporter [Pediococcus pentosaceus]
MWTQKWHKYYTAQVDENDCGLAALNMILKYYGSDYMLAHLRQLAKTTADGTTVLGLVKAAKHLNLNAEAVRADMDALTASQLPLPVIVHVFKKNKLPHYYVVYQVTENDLIIGDPDPTVKTTKISKSQFAKEWTQIAIIIAPTVKYKPIKESRHTLIDLVPLLIKQKRLIGLIITAAAITTLISIAGAYFFQLIIDTYLPHLMTNRLSLVAIGLIVAYAFQAIINYIQSFFTIVLGQRLMIDIVLKYVHHLFDLPMIFFTTRHVGEMTSRFSDASKIIDALGSTTLTLFLDMWILLAVGLFLAYQNINLFLCSLVVVPIYISIVWLFKKTFNRLNQDTMESNAVLNSAIIESLGGIETIKSLTGEATTKKKIDTLFSDLLHKNLAYQKADQGQQAIKAATKLILTIVILWWGTFFVMRHQLSLGQLLTYNALLAYFLTPLENIINLQPKLQAARVANNRLNEVYLVESEFSKSREITALEQLNGDIEVNHVSFNYGYCSNILEDVSLTIPHHQKITIVGMSGSGKTTLAKLLVGFFEPQEQHGEIQINHHNISDISRTILRQYINYVPQEPFIFSGSVLENLLLGSRPGVTQQMIDQACSFAEIKTDIENLPQGYHTRLSESGFNLSGGQKQRLSIARALLSPAQCFIFDESTSNLDTITEHKIVSKLLFMKDKTIIFVAHRLNIASQTDKVVVLDHGKIVEQGSHRQLLNYNGYYARLIHNQE